MSFAALKMPSQISLCERVTDLCISQPGLSVPHAKIRHRAMFGYPVSPLQSRPAGLYYLEFFIVPDSQSRLWKPVYPQYFLYGRHRNLLPWTNSQRRLRKIL